MRITRQYIDFGKYGIKTKYIPQVLKGLKWKGLHKFHKGILPSNKAIRVYSTKDRAVKMLNQYAKQIDKLPDIIIL